MKILYACIVFVATAAGAATLSLTPPDEVIAEQRIAAVDQAEVIQLIGLVVAPYKR